MTGHNACVSAWQRKISCALIIKNGLKMISIRRKWPLLVYAFAILHFTLSYCGGARPFLDLNKYMNYSERMPFQGRFLPAFFYNGASAIFDIPLFSFGNLLPPHLVIYSVVVTAISLLITLAVARDISRRHMGWTRLTREFVSVALLVSIYFSYLTGYEMKYFLPYDLPSIALWACILWLAYEGKGWLMVGTFAISALNRETSIVLVPCVIAIYHYRFRASIYLKIILLAAMASLWCMAKFFINESFQGNLREGNGIALNNFMKNAHLLLNPVHWPQLASVWGFLCIPFVLFWGDITDPCHRVFKWVVALTFMLLFVVGIVIEIRIFGELGLLVILCLAGRLESALQAIFGTRLGNIKPEGMAYWLALKNGVGTNADCRHYP